MEEKKPRYWEGNIAVSVDSASEISTNDGKNIQQVLNETDTRLDKLEGKFELIEEITLEENTSIIERTQTPGGKDYNFKQLLVFGIIKKNTNYNNENLYVFDGSNVIGTIYSGLSTAADRNYSISMNTEHGRLFCKIYSNAIENERVNVLGSGVTAMDSIINLKMGRGAPYYMAAGSTIKIYGIWA